MRNIHFFTKTILLSKSILICLFSVSSFPLYAVEDKLKIIISAEKNGELDYIAGSSAGAAKGILSQEKDLIKKLKPLAIISEDYPIIPVKIDSKYKSITELMKEFKGSAKKFNIYLGSLVKGLDHINFLVAAKKYNVHSSIVQYVESSGGGKAFKKFIVDKKMNILAIYFEERLRLKTCPNVPKLNFIIT